MDTDLQEYLESFLTPERYARVQETLNKRTKFLTVVLEDLSNPLNANACIRTLDCFGLQNLHVIENKHLFERDQRTSKGTVKWIDIFTYPKKEKNTEKCLQNLKNQGYKIVSLSPHASKNVYDLDYSMPIAFVFGNESLGVTDKVVEMSDEFVKLPMYGFAESFNISVSVAMTLQTARYQMENSGVNWQLSKKDKLKIYREWLPKAVNHSDLIIQRYKKNKATKKPSEN